MSRMFRMPTALSLALSCTLFRDCCYVHLTGDTCSLTASCLLGHQGEAWLKEAYRAAQRTRWQTSKDFQAALEAQLLQVCDSSPCTDNGEKLTRDLFAQGVLTYVFAGFGIPFNVPMTCIHLDLCKKG